MAGIYIHIPFCKTRCIYCDFYSTTKSNLTNDFIQALCKEIKMRKDYLKGEPVETIYFGGGTPSQLSLQDFQKIFQTINEIYATSSCNEITLEANPDDLTPQYLDQLSQLPFNRISIGIQTFNDPILKLLKRRHTSSQAVEAVAKARETGFKNISIDLMYGLPGETEETWQKDLKQAIALKPEHISAYHLIYEKGTPIYKMLHKQQVKEVDEEKSILFFTQLTQQLAKAGYKQYEISNFCLPDKYSCHNTSYWQGVKYLGCGPSAHSFDGKTREWNISSLTQYIKGIEENNRIHTTELLDTNTLYNELIITSMRTCWGLSLEKLSEAFGKEYYDYCLKAANKYIVGNLLEIENNHLKLTSKGLFVSDGIMSDLLKI